jgi:hypothetical protein
MQTFGVTVQAIDGQQFQTWITTSEDPGRVINEIRKEFDGK